MTDTIVYEVEFSESGREPEYRFFSDIKVALNFMVGITHEMNVSQMTYKAHLVSPDCGGFAQFLNQRIARDVDAIPF
jgi:hypothetical protein